MGFFSGKVMKMLINRFKYKQIKGWGGCQIIQVLFFNFSLLQTKIGIQLMVKFSFADI